MSYWRLNETDGFTAVDRMGANNASYSGSPTLNEGGALTLDNANRSVYFRGYNTNDNAHTATSASLDIAGGSAELWFRANDVTDNQKVLTLATNTGTNRDKFTIGVINGQLYPDLSTSTSPGHVYSAVVGTIAAGTWYQAVISYAPSDKAYNVYLNGKLLTTVPTDGNSLSTTGSAQVTIGGWAGVGFWFNGVVDDAAIYNHPLIAAQVLAHYTAAAHQFGTLLTQTQYTTRDYSVGVRVAQMDVGWNLFEPQDGTFADGDINTCGPNSPNPSYACQMKQQFRVFQAMGLKVILGVALQYLPSWVFSYPNSHYVNQFLTQAPNQLNLTFNQALRTKVEAFVTRVNQDLGLNSFWAVRVSVGSSGEVLFPPETVGSNTNSYWAFDSNAQGTGGNLPSTISPNPFPGWIPGQKTYSGQAFTTAQVGQWMDWYISALMDNVNWQIKTYRNLGYTGYVHVLLPGLGQRPNDYDCAVNAYLDGTCDAAQGLNQSMGRGAAWNRNIDKLYDPQNNTVIDISSVDDSSSQTHGGPSTFVRQRTVPSISMIHKSSHGPRRVGFPTTRDVTDTR